MMGWFTHRVPLGRARFGVLQAAPPLHGQGFLLYPHGLRR